jgi:hypothetical protein
MDHYAQILASLPGLEQKLEDAGFRAWIGRQPTVEVEGQSYVVLGGDRLASEAEAMVAFAVERGLVPPGEVEAAAARQPLPPDVAAVEIETPEGDD